MTPDGRGGAAPVSPSLAWSLMRCLFAFEICFMHVSIPPWRVMEPGWIAETFYMSATRSGTVGFMMLAGAILIGQGQMPAGRYLAHRFGKFLPAALFAQLLYWALAVALAQRSLADLTWTTALEPAWGHLWFFHALAVIYIAVIPARWYVAWVERLGPRAKTFALWSPIAALLTAQAIVTWMYGFWGYLNPINLAVYCGYAWVGYVLAARFPAGLPGAGWVMLLAVIAATGATAMVSQAQGVPDSRYFHRSAVLIAVASIAQFLLVLRIASRGFRPAVEARVHALARLTLGIYIIHPMFIELGNWTPGWALAGHLEWLSLPLSATLLFILSAAVTQLAFWCTEALARRWNPPARA